MPLQYVVPDIGAALLQRNHPAITRWNSVDGRPRTHDFERALRAEVRDALWMISKQWQMGEFRGEDAGSPVLARMCLDTSTIDRYQAAGGGVEEVDLSQPLEVRVERRPLPLRAGDQYLSLDVRMLVGRRWLKLLKREVDAGRLTADYRDAYVGAYPIATPDPAQAGHALVVAHAESWQPASIAAERTMDGVAFLEYIAIATNNAFDGIGAVASDEDPLRVLGQRLTAWFASLVIQPTAGGADAWLPSRFEYQFACAAPGRDADIVMRAEEYHHGDIDWHSLEHRPGEARLGDPRGERIVTRDVRTFLPSPILFEGMPNTRWWEYEDRRTNFGDVRPDTTDLGKLLVMEFALVYANDWFVFPYTSDIGTVTEVKGIAVTNTFGERLWVEPVPEQPAAHWSAWNMFTLGRGGAARGQPPAPSRLVLLPTVPKVQEGRPLEEVAFIRDEVANMVWAIERRIQLPSGASKAGDEAARELVALLERPFADVEPPEAAAAIRYQVMNTVPEHWIPFIAVHLPGSTRETQLQRAALPRIIPGNPDPPVKIRPRTSLLRTGMPAAYFVHEEEVPRAGAVVSQAYQRTRWLGGTVFTWFGARKQVGRGEGWSGLAFDQIVPARQS